MNRTRLVRSGTISRDARLPLTVLLIVHTAAAGDPPTVDGPG